MCGLGPDGITALQSTTVYLPLSSVVATRHPLLCASAVLHSQDIVSKSTAFISVMHVHEIILQYIEQHKLKISKVRLCLCVTILFVRTAS